MKLVRDGKILTGVNMSGGEVTLLDYFLSQQFGSLKTFFCWLGRTGPGRREFANFGILLKWCQYTLFILL